MKKILIVNRAEIACRIIKTCQKMGYLACVVYSKFDAQSRYVEMSDEAYFLDGMTAQETYLNVDKILEICIEQKIDAVHPGYGFLSENARFVTELEKNGIVFIGPNTKAMQAMGDKMLGRKTAIEQKVPVVPGWEGDLGDKEAVKKAIGEIGLPILLKASAGGGGKGIKIVHQLSELDQALESAAREAQKSFGDRRVFIEKYVVDPHHIEIQILADKHGNVLHLGERECSIQRRYQKLIEETPSPFVDEVLRQKMANCAITLAKAVGYDSVGTMEFLVDADKNFYFLEMNTRLQVEHPVTECVTGLDLVELMINIAFGQKIPFTQDQVNFKGHAIEARLIAEDPVQSFMPSVGLIKTYRPCTPKAEGQEYGIRLDDGFREGDHVTVHYDSLLAKVINYGPSRQEAIWGLIDGLNEFQVEGVCTNSDFTSLILQSPDFQSGNYTTHFIERHFKKISPSHFTPNHHSDEYKVIAFLSYEALQSKQKKMNDKGDIYNSEYYIIEDGKKGVEGQLIRWAKHGHQNEVVFQDQIYKVKMLSDSCFEINDLKWVAQISIIDPSKPSKLQVKSYGKHLVVKFYPACFASYFSLMPERKKKDQHRLVSTPMPGLLLKLLVQEGDHVEAGHPIALVEAMKMENVIRSHSAGKIISLSDKVGKQLSKNELLAEIG